MRSGQPSRTALGTARLRAVHQVLEHGRIFSDPLALRILGIDAQTLLDDAETNEAKRGLRLFIAVRARFAEDALAHAVAEGVRQLVVLGAGLDTYAYRTAFADRLRIFEVDHPTTQAWKRERLAAAAIRVPELVTFAPVDFEHESLAEGLAAAGFDPARRTFFSWLGVVPYLTESAVQATLAFIGGLSDGGTVVFDYSNPTSSIEDDRARAAHESLARRVAAAGEVLKCHFETESLHAKLGECGFAEIEDLGPAEIAARYFGGRGHRRPSDKGAHVVRAVTP